LGVGAASGADAEEALLCLGAAPEAVSFDDVEEVPFVAAGGALALGIGASEDGGAVGEKPLGARVPDALEGLWKAEPFGVEF